MYMSIRLTHADLSKALETEAIGVKFDTIQNLRQRAPAALIARIEDQAVRVFAEREGRSREVTLYLLEAALKEIRAQRAQSGVGNLLIALATREIEDQTLADSFRLIADKHAVVPEAITFVVSLDDYIAKLTTALPALTRLRLAGFGIALSIDRVKAPLFRALTELPITGLCLEGKETWRKLRTVGPGKLGALGSWIGWAEAQGLKRVALDVGDEIAEQTARLYGFPLAAGSYYAVAAAQTTSLKQAAG